MMAEASLDDKFTVKSSWKVFGGSLIRFSHVSLETRTTMTCSVYIPTCDSSESGECNIFPCIVYLSGLTCTDENVCQKSGAFKFLAQQKVRSQILLSAICIRSLYLSF